MKKTVCFLALLSSFTAYGQDLSLNKTGTSLYAEMEHPVKADPAEWAALKQNVNVSFASDNIRYPKEKVPVDALSQSVTLQAWKGEKVYTQLLIWSKTDLKSVRVDAGSLSGPSAVIDPKNISAGFVR